MTNRQLDGLPITNFDIPYVSDSGYIGEQPLIVQGTNVLVHPTGRISSRHTLATLGTTTGTTKRIDRLWEFQDSFGYFFLLASAYNSATGYWELLYSTGAFPNAFAVAGTHRSLDKSTAPHVLTIHRHKAYVKSFTDSSDTSRLGSLVLEGNGSGGILVKPWGLAGPATPAAVNMAGSAASANPITVEYTWQYSYAWKTNTGQISSIAPIQTNPSKSPHDTGPFTNKCPKITVRSHSSTNVTKIVIYRTSDGGGRYYFLDEISNPGGDIDVIYEDKYRESGASGGTFQDPKTDWMLDTQHLSPTFTSNNPPPTVLADDGKIVGTDIPEKTALVEVYAGRIWVSVKNVLFASGREEIEEGVPEESFPSGLTGLVFRFGTNIVGLKATARHLYVATTDAIHYISGTTIESFFPQVLTTEFGGFYSSQLSYLCPKNMIAFKDGVILVNNLGQVYYIDASRGTVTNLSEDVLSAIKQYTEYPTSEVELARWTQHDYDIIILFMIADRSESSPSFSVFPFDVKRQKWLPYWFLPYKTFCSATVSHSLLSVKGRHLLFGQNSNSDPTKYGVCRMTPTQPAEGWFYDHDPITSSQNQVFGCSFIIGPFRNPTGQHLNTFREPVLSSVLYGIKVSYSINNGGSGSYSAPFIQYMLNSIPYSATFFTLTTLAPARTTYVDNLQSLSGKVNKSAEMVFVKIINETTKPFAVHGLTVEWSPESGA